MLTDYPGDPEAEENKEIADEAKVPGADEVGPVAIEQGFGGNADWEVSGAAGSAFAAASATTGAAAGSNWDAGDWAAAPAGEASTEWGAEGAKPSEQW
jgi:small subunit ribosomal protein SAe